MEETDSRIQYCVIASAQKYVIVEAQADPSPKPSAIASICAQIIEKIEGSEMNQSYSFDNHNFNVKFSENIFYVCVCNDTYSTRNAFKFLNSLESMFLRSLDPPTEAAVRKKMMYFNALPKDKQLNKEIDQAKELLQSNVDNYEAHNKDLSGFRSAIKANIIPLNTNITFDSVFGDYTFEFGTPLDANRTAINTFSPICAWAVSKDPINTLAELFLCIRLKTYPKNVKSSNIKLVICLDISGSMFSPFPGESKPKLEIAKECILGILKQLHPNDYVGLVVFNDNARVVFSLEQVAQLSMEKVKYDLDLLSAKGATNMEAGLKLAAQQFSKKTQIDFPKRIIFLTDATPSEYEAIRLEEATILNTNRNTATTFIGIGVEFPPYLIEILTSFKSVNYHSVDCEQNFLNILDVGFNCLVTPVVYNLSLEVTSRDLGVDWIDGPPLNIGTLFAVENDKRLPNLIRLKTTKAALANPNQLSNSEIQITAKYEDIRGTAAQQTFLVKFPLFATNSLQQNHDISGIYQSSSIRKVILLRRYLNLLSNWCHDMTVPERPVHKLKNGLTVVTSKSTEELVDIEEQNKLPKKSPRSKANRKEIAKIYKEYFAKFFDHFESEVDEIDDVILLQELEVLQALLIFDENSILITDQPITTDDKYRAYRTASPTRDSLAGSRDALIRSSSSSGSDKKKKKRRGCCC